MSRATQTRPRSRRLPRSRNGTSSPPSPNLGQDWGLGWTLRRIGRGASAIEVLAAGSLAALPWLVHGFSTRRGNPRGPRATGAFNLGFTEGASQQEIEENRRRFLAAVGAAETKPLITLRQIHSDVSRVFTEPSPDPPQADAALTARPGLVLGIQTADCVPILLVDRKRRVVAVVHAGWRGILARVAQKALGRMRLEFGTDPADVLAAIGPSIGRCCYEVGPEVAQAFAGQFPQPHEWFDGPFDRLALGEEPNPLPWLTMMPPGHEPPPERVWLDLRAANAWQLTDAGVLAGHITTSSLCTACRTDLLFSYRREGAGTGRMMAVIGVVRGPLQGALQGKSRPAARHRAKSRPNRKKTRKKTPKKRRTMKTRSR